MTSHRPIKEKEYADLVKEVAILASILNSIVQRLDRASKPGTPQAFPRGYQTEYPDLSKSYFRDIITPLVAQVCGERGMAVKDILGHCRTKRVTDARHWVFYEAHKRGIPYAEIGRLMNRDHTTVIHGVAKEEQRRNAAGYPL